MAIPGDIDTAIAQAMNLVWTIPQATVQLSHTYSLWEDEPQCAIRVNRGLKVEAMPDDV